MDDTLLSIDCGTQSLRAMLFTMQGELIDKSQETYVPYTSPRPGWAEQDPEIYWERLCRACKDLSSRQPDAFARIAGSVRCHSCRSSCGPSAAWP